MLRGTEATKAASRGPIPPKDPLYWSISIFYHLSEIEQDQYF